MDNYSYTPTKYERFLINFCICDVLFLTYMPFVALSFSVPFTLFWVLKNQTKGVRLGLDREWKLYLIFATFVFLSCVVGYLIVRPQITQSIKTSVEIVLACLLYFVFKKYLKYVDICKYLCFFIYLGTALAIVYLVNRGAFISFKHLVNPNDGDSLNYYFAGVYSNFRYNFLWTDANNVAYMFDAILFLLLVISDYSFAKRIILYLCVFFIIITTMSTGGIIAFAVTTLLHLLLKERKIKTVISLQSFAALIVLVFVIIITMPYLQQFFSKNETILQSLDRVQNNSYSGDSRIAIWQKFLSNKPIYYYIGLGEGPIHIIYGRNAQPHNGFLFLIYGYGLIATIIFLKLFVIPNNIWRCYYYFPIIFGIFINTMLTNPKILGLIFIIKIVSERSCSKDYCNISYTGA